MRTTIARFPICGSVATGFEAVRTAFENNFIRHGEVGAAVHVTMDGKPVIDLWGGAADAAISKPWTADTLVNVWSTTKGWLALAMGYVMNKMMTLSDTRANDLCRAVYACLEN